MASAEKLLNEAQYAFNNVSVGASGDGRRSKSRARSLCRKIIRKYPTSTEAAEARAILTRLGDEAYTSQTRQQVRNTSPSMQPVKAVPAARRTYIVEDDVEALDWGGLIAWVLALPKAVAAVIMLVVLVLFSIFGPFLLLPVIALVFLSTPFRRILKPEQRGDLDTIIARANAFFEERRASG